MHNTQFLTLLNETINTGIKFDKLVAELNSAGMNIYICKERNINEIQKAHGQ